MDEFTNRIKGQSLSQLSGVLDGLADNIECMASDESGLSIAEKLRSIANELFDRSIDSQESYLRQDYELSKRLLARCEDA